MFCAKCGTQLPQEARFCANCGYEIQKEEQGTDVADSFASPKKKRKAPLLIGIFAIAIIALSLISIFVFGNDQASPEKTMRKYVEAVVDGDVDELIEIMYPKNILNRILEERETSFYEFEETLEDRYEYVEQEYRTEYGKNTRGSVRILNKERIDREEIREKEEYIESRYDLDVNISEAMKLECELTIRGSKDYQTDQNYITLYKIGGKWYVLEIW